MSISTFLAISNIATSLCLVTTIIVIIGYRKLTTASIIVGAICLCSVLTFLCFKIIELKGKQVNIPQNLYRIFYALLVQFVFWKSFSRLSKKIIFIAAIIFLIFASFNFLFIQKIDNNTFTSSVSAFIITICCVYFYYRLLVDLPVQKLQYMPMFWYSAAFLIYNAGTLFLYLMTPYLVEVLNNDFILYWSFHNILNIIQHIIIIIGLGLDFRNVKRTSTSSSASD
jgi:hypothetical protein